MSEKTKGQNLAETLFYKKKNAFESWSPEEREAAQKYCVDYMKFLDDGKTEREALVAAILMLYGATEKDKAVEIKRTTVTNMLQGYEVMADPNEDGTKLWLQKKNEAGE